MKHTKLYIALVLVGMFVLGAVTGAAVSRHLVGRSIQTMLSRPPQRLDPPDVISMLDLKLNLDADQKARIAAILGAYQPKIAALEPQLTALRDSQRDEIRTVLSPVQTKTFDQMISVVDSRRRRISSIP